MLRAPPAPLAQVVDYLAALRELARTVDAQQEAAAAADRARWGIDAP